MMKYTTKENKTKKRTKQTNVDVHLIYHPFFNFVLTYSIRVVA